MGKVIGPPLTEDDKKWILEQKLFFHASAPMSKHQKVNVSPKSSTEFRVINDHTVAWLDLSGSGSETCAHILENGRLTIMFVALTGPPKIMRLFGKGRFILREDLLSLTCHRDLYNQFKDLSPTEGSGLHAIPGLRCIILLDLERVSQSCGYSIPQFDFRCERSTLNEISALKGCDGMIEYRKLKNSFSIDGLRSIGQLEAEKLTQEVPTEVKIQDGYVFATKYGKSTLDNWMLRVSLSWQLHRSWFLPSCLLSSFNVRDMFLIASGAFLATSAIVLSSGFRHQRTGLSLRLCN